MNSMYLFPIKCKHKPSKDVAKVKFNIQCLQSSVKRSDVQFDHRPLRLTKWQTFEQIQCHPAMYYAGSINLLMIKDIDKASLTADNMSILKTAYCPRQGPVLPSDN